MFTYKIQQLSAEQTWPLRHQVLRPHQTLQDCIYPQDQDQQSFHIGAVVDGKIACIASFHVENHSELKSQFAYRLRGMATDPAFHQKGLGRAVLEKSLDELRERKCDLLWFNAREIAFPFYEKLGFQYLGDYFDIPGIGPHKVMYKVLN